ncbi:hypothetical protein JOQ06_003667 [Pogonophryne albipinna]|uniref:Uncharacterized protein n=1 Tax=Pogonophryne albipinna TaxID=1090488 RepID=A0AAD6F7W4_9TELE|nr:hypothetical protein JOQ06_003667 [Pogonophryne albipinna]
MRNLVDSAYSLDPRIKKFKDEEKARKEAEKKAKVEAKKREQEEKERSVSCVFSGRQAEIDAARLPARPGITSLRRNLDSVKMMEEVEKLCDRLELTSLQSLNEILALGSREDSKVAVVQEVNAQLQREKEAEVQQRQPTRSDHASAGGGGGSGKGFNEEDLQMLIKAVNLFPCWDQRKVHTRHCSYHMLLF